LKSFIEDDCKSSPFETGNPFLAVSAYKLVMIEQTVREDGIQHFIQRKGCLSCELRANSLYQIKPRRSLFINIVNVFAQRKDLIEFNPKILVTYCICDLFETVTDIQWVVLYLRSFWNGNRYPVSGSLLSEKSPKASFPFSSFHIWPIIEPWGTPQVIFSSCDITEPTCTDCVRLKG